MRRAEFDPLAYIENAFLDTRIKPEAEVETLVEPNGEVTVKVPTLGDFLHNKTERVLISVPRDEPRFRRTTMSAPRPRRAKAAGPKTSIDPELHASWELLPKNVEFLCSFYDDSVTANYYRGEFKETRQELVTRLMDPELTLEETSRLLGVCPATVRRYTNRRWLVHHRTQGGQRRFRLSSVVRFVHEHGRLPEG